MPPTEPPAGSRFPLPVSDHQPSAYDGPSRDEIMALRREYLNPGLLLYYDEYDEPICIVEGHMQYLWDEQGRQYLDAAGGIVSVSVGHCHPKVTERVRAQIGRLVHTTTLYLHPTIVLYARAIARHFPEGSGLTQTYFGNSGSEANEYATLLARLYTGHNDMICLHNGYHGGTGATMRLTGIDDWKFWADASINVHRACPGYCYRCPLGLSYPNCDLKCAHAVEDVIHAAPDRAIAGFIAEPIQGVGGVIVPPPEYFQVVYDIVHQHGGICIADEVQTGWGRTGEHFWGFENFGVVPDMVTMAKGIGNGAPLSAVTTRPEIAACLSQKLHFNTFGGNPVSVANGYATLQIIDDENIQQRARDIGGYFKDKLHALQDKHMLIGDVRGMGLLLAIELVKGRGTKEPAVEEAKRLVESAKQRGLLVGKSGAHWNTIRFAPPMCITKPDVDFLVDVVDAGLEDLSRV